MFIVNNKVFRTTPWMCLYPWLGRYFKFWQVFYLVWNFYEGVYFGWFFLLQPAIVSKCTLSPNLLKYRNQLFGSVICINALVSGEIWAMFKNTFFHRTLLVAASTLNLSFFGVKLDVWSFFHGISLLYI